MNRIYAPALIGLLMAGCAAEPSTSDAYGNFESVQTTVSAEIGGRLTSFSVAEGQRLSAGQVVAQVDTVQLVLQRARLEAGQRAVRARFPGIAAQEGVLRTQRVVAQRELARLQRLVAGGAATEKQVDDLSGQIEVLDQQVASARTANAPVFAELDVLAAQIVQIEDQVARAQVTNPVPGVVLTTFVQESEITGPGRPLYAIAQLDTLELRAYVSGAQLSEVRLGGRVRVIVDDPGGQPREGRVSWVSSQAEFTPKLIQTREERVSLVYAFKVRVPNLDGALKIGMPAEVVFQPTD
ncbi:MAG: HlyD family secretion protein [Rhodothermales bacterium]|jgi:HlyD family secretion protein